MKTWLAMVLTFCLVSVENPAELEHHSCQIDKNDLRNVPLGQKNSSQLPDSDSFEVNWNTLEFDFQEPETEIREIEFETFDEPTIYLPQFELAPRVKATKVKSTDKQLLRIARFGFSGENCMRKIVKPGIRGGSGGAYLLGTLTLQTTNGEIKLGVGNTGFSLGGRVPGVETEFYSPVGAELLSKLYCQETGTPLREELCSALSGIRVINDARQTFKQIEWTAGHNRPKEAK